MDANELRDRTKQFALRVIRLVDALPKSTTGRAIAGQLVRSGTSVGANFRASRRARSKKEHIAKLGVVVEEVDETAYWLELVIEAQLLAEAKVRPLQVESEELTRIFSRSLATAKRNYRGG